MGDLSESPTWEAGIYQIETTDPVEGGPGGTSNLQAQQLANRTAFLKAAMDSFGAAMGAGEVLIRNRGVITGCELTPSTGATRNLDIAEGRAFMHGHSVFVRAAVNAAAVPANSTGTLATVAAYIDELGDVAVTDIGQAPPDDALVLAELDIPDDNTEATDPYLAGVTIRPIARVEPGWPVVLRAPLAARSDFSSPIANPVVVAYEVVSWTGAEPDVRTAARDEDGIDIELLGSADDVTVRYVFTVVWGS